MISSAHCTAAGAVLDRYPIPSTVINPWNSVVRLGIAPGIGLGYSPDAAIREEPEAEFADGRTEIVANGWRRFRSFIFVVAAVPLDGGSADGSRRLLEASSN